MKVKIEHNNKYLLLNELKTGDLFSFSTDENIRNVYMKCEVVFQNLKKANENLIPIVLICDRNQYETQDVYEKAGQLTFCTKDSFVTRLEQANTLELKTKL